ncbi:hypothetical protein [Flavobacterium sp.]|uniref:hypothetical protein n=1 Tax=Flavobacterium sp. TaxID=239 RepID=UPI0024895201|nr:hypothetical protein [Flavobacterium sp.]MDI1318002.1 hypothetical protein [Flavobacterium sp.]
MKNLGFACLLLSCIVFQNCKKDTKEKVVVIEKPISVQCYTAVYEKDTLDLKINTLKEGKITGTMEMALFNFPKKVGELTGEVRGDTLFASYTFTQDGNKDKTFKNPMAFLKRGNELILGNGEIETTMGASYFVKGKPIDFDQVKYKFTAVECVDDKE